MALRSTAPYDIVWSSCAQIKALREHGRGSGERQAHLERLLGQLAQVREQDKKEAL